jgi:hypothetical protein
MRTHGSFRAALSYLDRGWAALALCPPGHQDVTDFHRATCEHPGKRPLGRWKVWQTRLPTLEEIAAQWEIVPRANVGVVTGQVSGLVGIDVDGEEGQKLLEEASGEDRTPPTLTFRTARGMRLLYALEPGTTVRSWTIRRNGGEVKVLGEGGLTVMPPSRHASGKKYRWLPRRGPGYEKLTGVPEWVLRTPSLRPCERRVSDEVRVPGSQEGGFGGCGGLTAEATIPEGRRNETLFRIACQLRCQGRTAEEILTAIRVESRRCVPPLSETEVSRIAQSASRYVPGRSGSPQLLTGQDGESLSLGGGGQRRARG